MISNLFSGFGIIYILINRIIERRNSSVKMETAEKPFSELAGCGNLVEKCMKIVETVAFHFKKSAHFKTGIISNNIINGMLIFFKIFTSMLTFFFVRKPYKIRTFAEIHYIKFFVVSAAKSKNFLNVYAQRRKRRKEYKKRKTCKAFIRYCEDV